MVVWMLFHVSIPPPEPGPRPRVRHLLIWGRQGLGGGHIMSKTVFQHCLQMVLKGGARFTCSWPQSPKDVLVGFIWGSSLSLSLISAFRNGSGDRTRGGGVYFSYSHLV